MLLLQVSFKHPVKVAHKDKEAVYVMVPVCYVGLPNLD